MKQFLLGVALCSLLAPKAFGLNQLPATFKLVSLESGYLQPENFKSQPSVVIFWASWCVSCSKAMQAIRAWKVKVPNLKVYAVSVDENMEAAQKYFTEVTKQDVVDFKQLSYLDAGAELAQALGVQGIPTVAWFDAQGKNVYQSISLPNDKDFRNAEIALGVSK